MPISCFFIIYLQRFSIDKIFMETLKSDILNTSAALFKKRGLRSVSIDDVCKELRISKKTFYNYFKQKEELIEQVLWDFHEQHRNKAKYPWDYEAGTNSIDMLMMFDKKMKFDAEENKKHISMVFDLEKYYPKIFQRHVDMMKEVQCEAMKNLINKGLNEGIFRQDLNIDLTALFIASQFGNLKNFVKNKSRKEVHQVFNFFRDMIIRILANEKGMEYYLKNYYN